MPISASISWAISSSSISARSASNLASRKIASAGATISRILSFSASSASSSASQLKTKMKGLAVSSDSSRSRSTSILVAMTGVPDSSAVQGLLGGVEVGGERPCCLARLLLQPRDRLLDGLEVGEDQLGRDRGDVGGGVDLAVDVGDVLVAEDAGHLADRGGLADVGEELVAQALALRGAAHDAGDVDELDGGRQHLGRPEHLRELREPLVGDAHDAHVGLDRGERVVRREHVVLGQGVEERRLARVGESDDADGESHGRGVYGGRRPPRRNATEGPTRRGPGPPPDGVGVASGAVDRGARPGGRCWSSTGRSTSRCTAGSA